MGCIFVMNPFRIRFEQVIIPGLHCALEHNNRFWRIQVVFLAFARAQLMKADRIERRIGAQSERIEGNGRGARADLLRFPSDQYRRFRHCVFVKYASITSLEIPTASKI